MIYVWQDFDENCRAMWGSWFGLLSANGHIVSILGPCKTQEELVNKLKHSH